MRVAIIEDGVVANVILADSATDFGGVECPDAVSPGWAYDGETFSAPVMPEPSQVDLAAYAAQKRWEVETGGITVGGMPVATDDRSKIMIIGARVKADADPAFTTQWKASDGFVTIDAATIIGISNAVLAHVDACFEVEGVVQTAITEGTLTTTAEIDAADWPA